MEVFVITDGRSEFGSIRYNRWERERVMEVFVITDGSFGDGRVSE